LGISKDLVTEGVQAVQGDPDIRGRDPFLQLCTALKVDATGTTLQRREDNTSVPQWRDITVLAGAEGMGLTLPLANCPRVGQGVRVSTGGTVELVRNPGSSLRGPLVNGKGLGTRRAEQNAHIRDIVGFAWVLGKVL